MGKIKSELNASLGDLGAYAGNDGLNAEQGQLVDNGEKLIGNERINRIHA